MATMLLIDDDSSVRRMLVQLFGDTHECHTADRAEQALEFLELEKYDVVVTDISMPGLGGVEILKRIKQRHSDTPVIVISGKMGEHQQSLSELGAFAYLPKPFRLDEIEATVNRAITGSQQRQR
jgi:two-component system response regulator PilR (NtrC family)